MGAAMHYTTDGHDKQSRKLVYRSSPESRLDIIWRCHRISISKLTHKLLNTNYQNKKYYGKPLCCIKSPETLNHMISYLSE
jgi:hypothetical protein